MSTANSARNRKPALLKIKPTNEATGCSEATDEAEVVVKELLRIVDEWQARDEALHAIACAGLQRNSANDGDDELVDRNLFATIGSDLESISYHMDTVAGIRRLAHLLGKEMTHG